MDSTLFEEWVHELDVKFQKENQKIALIIDNCPAHLTIVDLSNIKLIFLPSNTTSVSQPVDQRFTKCLKAFYGRRLVNLMIKRLEQGQDFNPSCVTTFCCFMKRHNQNYCCKLFRKSKDFCQRSSKCC